MTAPGVLEDPSPTEFLHHPDLRQVAAFFLGCVFFYSLQQLALSCCFRELVRRALGTVARRYSHSDVESLAPSEKYTYREPTSTHNHRQERCILLFALTLSLAFASVAQFATLLTFKGGSNAVCTFAVAWGGINAQFVRLAAFAFLIIELKRLGITVYEFSLLWIWFMVAVVFVFVTNAIGIGVTGPVSVNTTQSQVSANITHSQAFAYISQSQLSANMPQSPNSFDLCYRSRSLATALSSSLAYLVMETYLAIRLFQRTRPAAPHRPNLARGIKDIRVLRPLALITLELLTIAPYAVFTTIAGDFIPFSLGSIIVLAIFTYPTQSSGAVGPDSQTEIMDISPQPRSIFVPPPRKLHLLPTPIVIPKTQANRPEHPYAGKVLQHKPIRSISLATGQTERTMDSVSAQSVEDAIVTLATRHSAPLGSFSLSRGHSVAFDVSPDSDETGHLGAESLPTLPQRALHAPQETPSPSSRRILDQTHYALVLERQGTPDGLSARPERNHRPDVAPTSPPADARPLSQGPSVLSGRYGSDIVRGDDDRPDKTRRRRSASTRRTRMSFFSSTLEDNSSEEVSTPWRSVHPLPSISTIRTVRTGPYPVLVHGYGDKAAAEYAVVFPTAGEDALNRLSAFSPTDAPVPNPGPSSPLGSPRLPIRGGILRGPRSPSAMPPERAMSGPRPSPSRSQPFRTQPLSGRSNTQTRTVSV